MDAVKELVRARSVDGVILKNTKPQDERVKFLLESGLPFVAFGRTELLSDHAFFDIDHESVGARAAKLLFDAGHYAPLIIAPPRDLTYSRLFLKGWREAHAASSHPFDESKVIFSAVTPNSGLEIAKDIFARGTSRHSGVHRERRSGTWICRRRRPRRHPDRRGLRGRHLRRHSVASICESATERLQVFPFQDRNAASRSSDARNRRGEPLGAARNRRGGFCRQPKPSHWRGSIQINRVSVRPPALLRGLFLPTMSLRRTAPAPGATGCPETLRA